MLFAYYFRFLKCFELIVFQAKFSGDEILNNFGCFCMINCFEKKKVQVVIVPLIWLRKIGALLRKLFRQLDWKLFQF